VIRVVLSDTLRQFATDNDKLPAIHVLVVDSFDMLNSLRLEEDIFLLLGIILKTIWQDGMELVWNLQKKKKLLFWRL